MDAKYWEAAAIVMDHVASEGGGRRAISYHRRGIAQQVLHLDLSARKCTRGAAEECLSVGERIWSRCKHKEKGTAARRLLEALTPSLHSHPGPTTAALPGGPRRSSTRT